MSERPEPWLSTVARVLVHGITAGVIAFPLTVPVGVAAAVLGAASGSFAGRFLARTALRTHVILLAGSAALLGVLLIRFAVVDLAFVPQAFGPSAALNAGEAAVFGLGGLVLSAVLRALSLRRRALGVIEAALVAGGFATLLVAHRNGAIHRPYEIADVLIARGEDPTLAILVIGALGAAVIGLLLLSERSLGRSAFHLAVVAALLLAILGTTALNGLPPPPSTGGALGLQDDTERGRRDRRGGESAQGRRRSDELEFLDQYPDGQGAPDAIVIFHDDYSSPTGVYYFRQNAFSQYNGQKLVAATGTGLDEDVRNVFPTNRARDVAWVPEAATDRSTIETTVGLLADNSAPLGLEAPVRFIPATNPNPERFRRLYRVHSNATTADLTSLLGREVGDPTWSEETRAHYLRGPDDPRYRALAERIVALLPEELRDDPVAKALAITQYLSKHGTYSLRSNHAGAPDPTADFLFGDLTGYCVHFAHAAVFLMRSIGIPARVGTGYAVAEANRQGGSGLLLRNSDQHAWPEVYVGGAPPSPPRELVAMQDFIMARADDELDWLPAETLRVALGAVVSTATERFGLSPSSERDARLRLLGAGATGSGRDDEDDEAFPLDVPELSALVLAEMETIARDIGRPLDELLTAALARAEAMPRTPSPAAGWIVMDVAPENVLDGQGEPPDPELQRLLAEMARGAEPLDDAPSPPRPLAELVRELRGPTLDAVAIVLAAVFAFFAGNKVRRRVAPLVTASPRAIFIAALDALSEGGLRREWGESHEAFAARMARELPSLSALTHGHLASSFGRRADEARIGAMKSAARALRAELKRVVPWWRRALGWINPFSWLLTR